MHDARVFLNSDIFNALESGEIAVSSRFPLLADAAYPALNFILPPFKDNGALIDRQNSFNKQTVNHELSSKMPLEL